MEGLHQRLAEDKLVGLIEQQQDIIVLEHNQTVADALRVRQLGCLATSRRSGRG